MQILDHWGQRSTYEDNAEGDNDAGYQDHANKETSLTFPEHFQEPVPVAGAFLHYLLALIYTCPYLRFAKEMAD